MTTEKMTAEDFAAWVEHMRATRSWSKRDCAKELGCGVNQIKVWSMRGAPPHIERACMAILYRLPSWRWPPPFS